MTPYASTLSSVSGTLGPLIPPSVSLAMYGVTCSVSIRDLLIAGSLPGICLAVVRIGFIYFVAKKKNYGIKREKKSFKNSSTLSRRRFERC